MALPAQPLNNNRKYPGHDYTSVVQCFLESEPLQSCEASTINVSAGGVCLCLDQRLSVGRHIEIGKNILPIFCKTARVCWAQKISDGKYLTGIEFSSQSK